jgi:hypothetical protein
MRRLWFLINRLVLAAVVALPIPPSASACSGCSCLLNTHWDSQGYAGGPGLRLDLRYDDIHQSHLREGTKKVDTGSVAFPTDREIQQSTRNRAMTVGVDYAPNGDWGFNLQLPLLDRPHTTIVDGDTDVSGSRTAHAGDAQLTARYQGFLPGKNLGIRAGIKFPTGPFQDVFRDGPQAGQPLDRGLQAGTGTTDLLLGLYRFGSLGGPWGYFSQVAFQQPLRAREDYKPGASWVFSLGARCVVSDRFQPQFQLVEKIEGKESGDQADRENSGSSVLYAAPGLSVGLGARTSVFGFVQLPVHQNVNGYQLVPRAAFSLGLRYVL